MSDFKTKMHQIRFRLGKGGEGERGRKGKGREGEERVGEGKAERRGREKEGKERGLGLSLPKVNFLVTSLSPGSRNYYPFPVQLRVGG